MKEVRADKAWPHLFGAMVLSSPLPIREGGFSVGKGNNLRGPGMSQFGAILC